MKFVIKSVYQKEDMVEFQRVVEQTVQRGKTLLFRSMFFILGILFLVAGCSVTVNGGSWTWTLGGVIAGLVLLYPAVFYYKVVSSGAWRRWKRSNGGKEISYTFDKEGIQEEMAGSSFHTRYAEVYACFENTGYFFLFLSKQEGYILKKSDFTEGQPEKFKSALEKWCSGSIQVYPVSNSKKSWF